MNDDLISRKAVIDLIESCHTIEDAYCLVDYINELPTAYDVNKVVEELQHESDRWKESGEEYEDKRELGVAEGFLRSIRVVKSGGTK